MILLCYKFLSNGDDKTGKIFYYKSPVMLEASQIIADARDRIKNNLYVPSGVYGMVSNETEQNPLTCMLTGFSEYNSMQELEAALDAFMMTHLNLTTGGIDNCINLMELKENIRRLRYILTVHSGLYYNHNVNVITDDEWDATANKLVELQKRYPSMIYRIDFFDEIFSDFTGDTGMHLPWREPGIADKIYSLGKQWGVL